MGVLNTCPKLLHSKVKYKFVFYKVSSPPSPSSLLRLPIVKNRSQDEKTNQIGCEVTVTFECLGFALRQENSVLGLPKAR